MSDIEYFIENPHVDHDAIHAVVVVAGQDNFCDSFEDEKCLLARETIID
jgi:hypothetical protein